MAHFFATPDDLLPVLVSVEAKHSIVYTPCGHVHKPKVAHFSTARNLPTLFQPQPYESAVGGPAYLITEAGTDVVLRQLSPYEGKDRWSVDQLANPDSTVLRHGGLYGDNVLLHGDVGTAYKTNVAMRLQRAFDAAIRKHFVKIGSFYVGPGAEALLDSGWRLTAAKQCPPEFDLCRPIRSPGSPAEMAVTTRRSLQDSWRYLEAEDEEAPRHPDGRPFIPDRMPSFDDDKPFGLRYFRSGLEDADRCHLTMPRTYFGRSWFIRINYSDSELTESRMCWNDFDDCDFSGADLSGCDMRASIYTGCKFIGAVLRGADLRRSTFQECDFAGADLTGAVAVDADFQGCVQDFLTDEQQAVMAWAEDLGPEPPGG
jgi:hypothetical protein